MGLADSAKRRQVGLTRVLVAEDEHFVREALTRILNGMDCEVIQASDGLEAKAQLLQGGFDLVVTDLSMPRADGFEVLRSARETQPPTPVLIMTGKGSTEECLRAMRAGAFNFLSKPFHPAELREVVRDALSNRTPQVHQLEEPLDFDVRQPQLTLVGESPQLHELLDRVDQVAATDAAVLIVGERGTGKEAIARMLHALSPRAGAPFVVARVADRTSEEIERELFGEEGKPGRLSSIPGASLLLTDISGLDPALQSEIARSFSLRTSGCDVRLFVDVVPSERTEDSPLVSALRDDFGALVIDVPPLRDRIDDVPVMVEHLVDDSNRRFGAKANAEELIASFGAHAWPGNLAELEKRVDNFVSRVSEVPPPPREPSDSGFALPVERRSATLTLQDGTRHEVELSLGAGQRIEALFEPDEAFLPAHQNGKVRIYARSALACIAVALAQRVADATELAQHESAIRVQLRSGGVVEGALRYVPVEGRARVTDLLNEPAPSFAVHADGRVHHVAKAHVLYGEER